MRMNQSDSLAYYFSIETPFKQALNLVLKRSTSMILYVIPFILNAAPYIVITVLIIIFFMKKSEHKVLGNTLEWNTIACGMCMDIIQMFWIRLLETSKMSLITGWNRFPNSDIDYDFLSLTSKVTSKFTKRHLIS